MAAIRFQDRPAAPEPEPPAASEPGPDGPQGAPERDCARVTPMMAQYLGIKAQHPDALLFYRMGDFYELFLEDAVVAASVLGIVLTKRGKHEGEDIAMCGVPVERSDDYLHTLIARGHTVAVCEQTEDPAEARKRGGKSVVRRAVVRIVTPGTITEERLLEPGRANLLAALSRVRRRRGDQRSSASRRSTSRPAASPWPRCRRPASRPISPASSRARPWCRMRWPTSPASRAILDEAPGAVTRVAREAADPVAAERRLAEWYGVATLDGFGAFTRAELAAAATARGLHRPHPDRRAPDPAAAGPGRARPHGRDRRRDPRQSRNDAHARRRAPGLAAPRRRRHGDAGRARASSPNASPAR